MPAKETFTLKSKKILQIIESNKNYKDSWARIYKSQGSFIKVIDDVSQKDYDRIKQTCDYITKINHPNILKVKDYAIQKQRQKVYLVLQESFIDLGELIKQRLQQQNRLSFREVVFIIQQFINGYEKLKECKLAGTSIAISNILVSKGLEVKISSVSFRKMLQNDNQDINSQETINYNSYEFNIGDKDIDQKNIVWMLGIILFQTLEGFHPWRASTRKDFIQNIRNIRLQFNQIRKWKNLRKLISLMLIIKKQKRIGWKIFKQLFGQLKKDLQIRILGKRRDRKNQKLPQFYEVSQSMVIGKGGFGKVYKCDRFAIKQVILDQKNRKQVKQETKLLLQFNHKNIIKCYEAFQENSMYYIVLQYCQQDLENYLNNKRKLDEKQVVFIFRQILTGYTELIRKNIIHRDLKIANILITKDKIVKITDFGLSKKIDYSNNQMLQTRLGTPTYMSPQIVQKENYTSKSQIWALGIILFQLTFGESPCDFNGLSELRKNLKNKILNMQKYSASDQIKYIIRKMLQFQEKERIDWIQLFQYFNIKNNLEEKLRVKQYYEEDKQPQIIKKVDNNKNNGHQKQRQVKKNNITPDIKNNKINQQGRQVGFEKNKQNLGKNENGQNMKEQKIQARPIQSKAINKNVKKTQQQYKKPQQNVKKVDILKNKIIQRMKKVFLREVYQNIEQQLLKKYVDDMSQSNQRYLSFIIQLQSLQDQSDAKKLLYRPKQK